MDRMRHPKVDLNLLVALRALLAERNVTRAAESLHITQPAMSAALARLREHFDDALLVQVGRRMELTALAQGLAEPLGDLLVRIDGLMNTRAEHDPATSRRRFTVAASDYVFEVLLAEVLGELSRSAPGVCVQVIAPSDDSATRLEAGEIDLLVAPEQFASSRHPSLELFQDDHRLIADAGNLRVGERVGLQEFLDLGHVVYEHNGRSFFDVWFDRTHGPVRRIEALVHSFAQIPRIVASTPRVAVMLTRMARRLAPAHHLRIAQLDFSSPRMSVVLQWHEGRENDMGLAWLRGVIEASARALDAVGP
jgi:DNA-binding transcriptional LysR family regulator